MANLKIYKALKSPSKEALRQIQGGRLSGKTDIIENSAILMKEVMMSRINADQKETAIETIRIHGTMKAGAEAAGVSVRTLNEEMRRSAIFKKRILEAREEGKRNIADNAIDRIKEYAFNPPEKTDRNVLTAAIALANAYEPGFRGTTTVQGRIDHDVRVITAVPRPKYEVLDTPPKKMLKSGKRIKKIDILDKDGKYIGTQTVERGIEEAIEGEVIKNGMET